MQKIISVPDQILRQPSQPVKAIDSKTITFIHQLGQALIQKTNPPGVGLSAIQVGKPLRIFFTYLPKIKSLPSSKWTEKNLELTVYINPQTSKVSSKVTLGGKSKEPFLEGCLSIPHIYGPVWRHEWVEIKYHTFKTNPSNLDNPPKKVTLEPTKKRFKGFAARVVEHEYDHLEGILFTDYALGKSPVKSFQPLGKIDTPLYFDQDRQLVPLKNPEKIINW